MMFLFDFLIFCSLECAVRNSQFTVMYEICVASTGPWQDAQSTSQVASVQPELEECFSVLQCRTHVLAPIMIHFVTPKFAGCSGVMLMRILNISFLYRCTQARLCSRWISLESRT